MLWKLMLTVFGLGLLVAGLFFAWTYGLSPLMGGTYGEATPILKAVYSGFLMGGLTLFGVGLILTHLGVHYSDKGDG